MATVNKFAVLQKTKQEKGLIFRSFSNKLTKKNQKHEKWKEETALAQSHSMIDL